MALGPHKSSVPPPGPALAAAPRAGGWTTRLGEACLLGLGVACLSAVPTALRTAGAGGPFLEGLLVGAAVLLPLVTLSLVLARAAGRGFRGIVGQGSARLAVLRVALWIGVAVPLLAALAALLKAATHHRGLAGATFGVFGLGAVAAAALVAHRLVALGDRLAARGVRPWILAAAGVVIGVLPLLAVASPLARGGGGPAAVAIRAAIVDGAIALVATALVSSIDLGVIARRAARLAGVPVAALVLIAAAARLESSPPLGRAVQAGGGLAATILAALERWTDRDDDGQGAHFGGGDCDEGDPARRAGAAELPGDGVDQDCDGIDPEGAAPARLAAVAPAPGAPGPAPAPGAPGAPAAPSASAAPGAAPAPPPSAAAAAPAPARGERPDIILVTLDTVRADHTSAYGYGRDTTPRLKELAARGVLFERAYAPASDTQRATVPIVVGRRLSRVARDRREWPTLYPENDTLAERLKRAGYVTAAVSSFTWISEERGFAQGFDRFEEAFRDAHPEREITGHHAVARATRVLTELAQRAAPIFLWVHLFDAHERHVEHPEIRLGKGPHTAYDGEVAWVDRQLGALVDVVAAVPRAGRTAFIVHGSHGEALGEHDVTGHGVELYDEAIRVPLVIALPGAKGGLRFPRPVSTVDIGPTLLDIGRAPEPAAAGGAPAEPTAEPTAAGGAPAEAVEGESLAAIAAGDLDVKRGPVFARGARRGAVIDWPLKLIVIERKKRNRYHLFDLEADPDEARDQSEVRHDDLERLIATWEKLEAAGGNAVASSVD